MNTRTASALFSLAFFGLLAGCGGGGSSSPAPPPPPPPPVTPMSAAGIWVGEAVTPDIPNGFTGFEGPDDSNGFIVGISPFSANFQGGVTETRGIQGFYADGVKSWHIAGTSAAVIDATITFETPASALEFFTRTVPGGAATIDLIDTIGGVIQTIVPPNAATPQQFAVDTAGGLPIASVNITVTTGEIVIDGLTFGYPSTASTDDIACVLAPNDEFACVIFDDTTGAPLGGANGTYSVNGDQVSGTGSLYAAPGEMLADGSTVADLTISAGTVVEGTSLNITIDSTGLSIAVTSLFDDTYDRGSDLATVGVMYNTSFDIFGDISSFAIDATTGVISGQSVAGCVLSGTVSIIDAAANTYDVNLVVADVGTCGALVGDYDGLGSSQDEAPMAMDDAFIFAVFVDGVKMIVAQAIK